MKILTEDHKKSISDGLLKASAEGRIKPPKRHVTEKGLDAISELTEQERKQRGAKAGKTMSGRPQRLDTVIGAKEDNIHAKEWELKSPSGIIYKIKNVNNFIRENADLFNEEDIVWKGCSCRASVGLHSLNQINKKTGKPRAWSWKGWRGNAL